VQQGDEVKQGQLLAVIQPEEWKADMAYYADSEQQSAAHVDQAEADLRYQEAQTRDGAEQAAARLRPPCMGSGGGFPKGPRGTTATFDSLVLGKLGVYAG